MSTIRVARDSDVPAQYVTNRTLSALHQVYRGYRISASRIVGSRGEFQAGLAHDGDHPVSSHDFASLLGKEATIHTILLDEEKNRVGEIGAFSLAYDAGEFAAWSADCRDKIDAFEDVAP